MGLSSYIVIWIVCSGFLDRSEGDDPQLRSRGSDKCKRGATSEVTPLEVAKSLVIISDVHVQNACYTSCPIASSDFQMMISALSPCSDRNCHYQVAFSGHSRIL